jgi:Ulp1 family protease
MAMRHKNKPILFRNAGNRKIPTYNVSWDDFRRLQPDKWLGDEVVNGYSSLIQNATGSDIVILSSFFITTLCKEGYRKVSRWLKVNLLSIKDYANYI